MYEELARRLRRCEQFKCRECEYEQVIGCRAKLNAEAADAIEELMRRCEQLQYMPPPAWIPVTERLPKRGKNVLVANKRGKQWDIDKAWLSCYGSGFDRCGKRSLYHVTHWMPLPQPPKEENTDNDSKPDKHI